MLQNYSRYRILQEFFESPKKDFYIRALSRATKIAAPSIMNHLDALLREGYIIREKNGIYPSFRANTDNCYYRLLKQQNLVFMLKKSGLLEFIEEKTKPNCIILFGSASRGEDTETSDIDLFVQSQSAGLNLEKYEKLLKRRIIPLFEPNLKSLSKELLNNLVNGQVLYGFLEAF
jgi:predicted nucleotidyltransferase